jgi:KTSC domain
MDRIPIESKTGMCSYGYDPLTQILEIEFKSGKEGEATKLYQYANVTQADYDKFHAAPSKGSHFRKYIQMFFLCNRVVLEKKGKENEGSTQGSESATKAAPTEETQS